MNKQNIFIGVALILGVLGLVLPQPSIVSSPANTLTVDSEGNLRVVNSTGKLGGTTNLNSLTLDGTLATVVLTASGATTFTASSTFNTLQMGASSSANGIIYRSTTSGQCTLFTYSGTTGNFVTSSMTCL